MLWTILAIYNSICFARRCSG